MAKKTFDIKGTLASSPRSLSVDDIESATRQIHTRQPEPPAAKPAPEKAVARQKQAAPPPPAPVGRPSRRDPDAPPERKVRLSVDVRPDIHKRLRIRAIENDSDIKRYVEMLIERDLS